MGGTNRYLGPSPRAVDAELRAEVGSLRARGFTHAEVAERLGISERSSRRATAKLAKLTPRPSPRSPMHGTLLREPLPLEVPPGSAPFEVVIDFDFKFTSQPYLVAPSAPDVETWCAARAFSVERCARLYAQDLIEGAKAGLLVLAHDPHEDDSLHLKGCPGLRAPRDCPALCSVEGRPARWDHWDMSWAEPAALEEIARAISAFRCLFCGYPHGEAQRTPQKECGRTAGTPT